MGPTQPIQTFGEVFPQFIVPVAARGLLPCLGASLLRFHGSNSQNRRQSAAHTALRYASRHTVAVNSG